MRVYCFQSTCSKSDGTWYGYGEAIIIMMMMIWPFIRRRKRPWSNYKGTIHLIHAMNAEQCQTATGLWTKPTDLSHWPAFRQLWKYIHYRGGTSYGSGGGGCPSRFRCNGARLDLCPPPTFWWHHCIWYSWNSVTVAQWIVFILQF